MSDDVDWDDIVVPGEMAVALAPGPADGALVPAALECSAVGRAVKRRIAKRKVWNLQLPHPCERTPEQNQLAAARMREMKALKRKDADQIMIHDNVTADLESAHD